MDLHQTQIDSLENNLRTILATIFNHSQPAKALVVYDEDTELSRLLAHTYQKLLPQEKHINFSKTKPEDILQEFAALKKNDLVILVQSSSFRLDAFRIRVHLFKQELKVLEHPHLGRIRKEEFDIYIDTLAYDQNYYQSIGNSLKSKIDQAKAIILTGNSHHLVYAGPFEESKLNIGDYSKTRNIGSQFPIGEVFTELKKLDGLNGSIGLFAFGAKNFSVIYPQVPIIIKVENGKIIHAENSVPEFDEILNDIRTHEGEIWVRELGFGLNRAMTREKRILGDVGTYERMCGIHLSLGAKHALYPKEGFSKKKVKYHVDVFAAVDSVKIDDAIVFEHCKYI